MYICPQAADLKADVKYTKEGKHSVCIYICLQCSYITEMLT